MAYTPNNTALYDAALGGALGAIGNAPSVNGAGQPAGIAQVAGAFAQELDTVWGTIPATDLDVKSALAAAFGYFSGKTIRVNSTTTTPLTYLAACTSIVAFMQAGDTFVGTQGVTPQGLFLVPPVSLAAGGTANLLTLPVNNIWANSTGAQDTVLLPIAPNNGDVVMVKMDGASVASPVLVTARGGFTVENPGNAGNYSPANGNVTITSQGQNVWWQFQSANGRWGIITNA
jgi:hypothetical protein